MKVIDITFEDFFKFLNFDNNVNTEETKCLVDMDGDGSYFAVTPEGSYSQIEHVIKKPKQEYVRVEVKLPNGDIVYKEVSPKHIFISSGENIFAEDLGGSNIDTIYGSAEVLSVEKIGEDYLYDISIEDPHHYIDEFGIIHHNSFVGMKVSKNFQKRKPENIVIYVDTEMAFDYDFANNVGLDIDRLLVVQSNQIEDVQRQIMAIMTEFDKEEKKNILLVIDSWGGLVTSKTVEDATTGKDVTDMTIAKKKNTFAKLLTGLRVSTFVVNQVYDSMDKWDPIAIGGGRGLYFASSSIVLGTSKSKAKETQSSTDVIGAAILATTKKSRFCKELTKLRYRINYDGGIDPWWGLLEDALEGGYITKPSMGFYSRAHIKDDKKWREREINENGKDFWLTIIKDTDFPLYIEKKYTFQHSDIEDEDFEF